MMKPFDIETAIKAADAHGEDYPDHTVGDLQDHLRDMWGLLTPQQRDAFSRLESVLDRVAMSTSGEESGQW